MTNRHTFVVLNRHALRSHREQAARAGAHGRIILTIEQLAARLAGGFLQSIPRDKLQDAVRKALHEGPIGELESLKDFPGLQRAVSHTLDKAWHAGLDLDEFAKNGSSAEAARRLGALGTIEARVLGELSPSMRRPKQLVASAVARIQYAKRLFGKIFFHGFTELSPVWRPLVGALAENAELVWVAGPRYVPDWIDGVKVSVERAPAQRPELLAVSCASPRHEILEAFRWVRNLIVNRGVKPHEIGLVTVSPQKWDSHVMALMTTTGLRVHFVHGHAAMATADGQCAAALAEVLLRGFSQARLIRLVALLRLADGRFKSLPRDWWRVLPEGAPLLNAEQWRNVLAALKPAQFPDRRDHAPLLIELLERMSQGLEHASAVGEALLSGRSLAIWQRALQEGPPAALDVTLESLRVDDALDPGEAIVWGPADALAAAPRPYARLVDLTSRAWPRVAAENPLLPDHIVPASALDPLPVHEADRRDFDTILKTTSRQVVLSRSRRASDGRQLGTSPLYAHHAAREIYHKRARIPGHAAGEADRLLARPAEFDALPRARSALECWVNWHSLRLTPHDGLVPPNHPVVMRAVSRRQSATSLAKLLRDPLGYLWTYAFAWQQPSETEEPLRLDARLSGELLHAVLERTVGLLELHDGGLGAADEQRIRERIEEAVETVSTAWTEKHPTPPPVLWGLYLQETGELAARALLHPEDPLPAQKSFAELPFGGQPAMLQVPVQASSPWDPERPVLIPGTDIRIAGLIDRLDLAGDGKTARVTDYKSGQPPGVRTAPPTLQGGAELQRCLYAFAVRYLLGEQVTVESRLLYPRATADGLFPLHGADELLELLTGFIVEARDSLKAGNALPGTAAEEQWNDLAFALPGGAKETYFDLKRPLVAERLGRLPQLWEMK